MFDNKFNKFLLVLEEDELIDCREDKAVPLGTNANKEIPQVLEAMLSSNRIIHSDFIYKSFRMKCAKSCHETIQIPNISLMSS